MAWLEDKNLDNNNNNNNNQQGSNKPTKVD